MLYHSIMAYLDGSSLQVIEKKNKYKYIYLPAWINISMNYGSLDYLLQGDETGPIWYLIARPCRKIYIAINKKYKSLKKKTI